MTCRCQVMVLKYDNRNYLFSKIKYGGGGGVEGNRCGFKTETNKQ